MNENVLHQSPPPKRPGCGKILLIILALFFLKTNYSTVSRVVQYMTINLRSGDDVARKYLEANPWPNTPEDAVRKCFFAIESRSWEDYRNCFEPSATLAPVPPGPPGKFRNMSYVLVEKDDDVAIVCITGEWHPSSIIAAEYQVKKIHGRVLVVRASKGVLKDVKLPLVDISLSKRGWFVAYSQSSILPYNFGEQDENGALIVAHFSMSPPTPTSTPDPVMGTDLPPQSIGRKVWSISPLAYFGILIVVIILGSVWLSKRSGREQKQAHGNDVSTQDKNEE